MTRQPIHTEATELGETKKAIGTRCGRRMLDLENFDEVYELARRLHNASPRLIMAASVDELRALAKLAMLGGAVIAEASTVFALSDAGAPRKDISAAMVRLAQITRPILGNAS